MPLYIADYRRKTADLTTREHGAYLLLIMYYWDNGPPIDDDKTLARIVGMKLDHWKRIRPKIEKFFRVELKGQKLAPHLPLTAQNVEQLPLRRWHHERIDEEILRTEIIRQKRQLAGMAGGRKSAGYSNVWRHYNKAFAKQMGD